MQGDDNTDAVDVTDSIPMPRATPRADAPTVVVSADGAERQGPLLSVQGDQVAVVVDQGWPMDTQVEVSTGAIRSVGVVIWTRADQGKVAVGIEIVGGTAEWADLL
ncbi:MAG: hypothetical protein KTR31_07405 [Myxococcales bacterium]|nr:hypothetical protein [Myxococcales bacterium]